MAFLSDIMVLQNNGNKALLSSKFVHPTTFNKSTYSISNRMQG